MQDLVLWLVLALQAVVLLGLWRLWASRPQGQDADKVAIVQAIERTERELRLELQNASRGQRQELAQTLTQFQESIVKQSAESARTHNLQLDQFCLLYTSPSPRDS